MNVPTSPDEIVTIFDSELIGYLARRYGRPVREIIRQFLIQNGNECPADDPTYRRETGFTLESNEMEILRAYYNRCYETF